MSRGPIDLAGQVFGRLTAVKYLGQSKWRCSCECGGSTTTTGSRLRKGKTSSCGCLQAERISKAKRGKPSPRFIDLTGQSFGRLTSLRHVGYGRWDCVCSCGNSHQVYGATLRNGSTQSCGCWKKERDPERATTHGVTISAEHRAWGNMKDRCHNPRSAAYEHYGAKGVRVCERWRLSFEDFLEDMGPRPEGLTLERADVQGDYTPENCRWASWVEQARNRRNTTYVKFEGGLVKLCVLAESVGIHRDTLRQRYGRGDRDERLVRPVRGPA